MKTNPLFSIDFTISRGKIYRKTLFRTFKCNFCDILRNRHTEIRKRILKHVKREFYLQNDITTSIKEKELNFIGFLIDSRSRVSRKKINKEELNLKKYLKNNEINYLQSFT